MSGEDPFFLIAADQIDVTQRNLIQHAISEAADEWWHELLDVWIVRGGESSAFWRKLLSVFVPFSPSGLLVLRLPPRPEDRQAAWRMPNGSHRAAWIKSVYRGESGSEARWSLKHRRRDIYTLVNVGDSTAVDIEVTGSSGLVVRVMDNREVADPKDSLRILAVRSFGAKAPTITVTWTDAVSGERREWKCPLPPRMLE